MARTLSGGRNPGDCVYRSFQPMQPGIVLDSKTTETRIERVSYLVLWWNGETSWLDDLALRDFDDLIESHKRKYERFADMRSKLWEKRNALEASHGPKP